MDYFVFIMGRKQSEVEASTAPSRCVLEADVRRDVDPFVTSFGVPARWAEEKVVQTVTLECHLREGDVESLNICELPRQRYFGLALVDSAKVGMAKRIQKNRQKICLLINGPACKQKIFRSVRVVITARRGSDFRCDLMTVSIHVFGKRVFKDQIA